MSIFARNANAYRVALLIGAIDVPDVIAWADSEIAASEIPSNSLIDISLGRSKTIAEIASLLAYLAVDTSDECSLKRGIGMLANRIRAKQIDVQTAIMNCYRCLQSENLLYNDDFRIFVNLEDDVSLIRDGIFGPDKLPELESDLLAALDEMTQYTENAG